MSLAVVFAVLFIVLSLKLILSARRRSTKKGNLPPSPPSLPILGHLFYVKKPLHNTYASLAAEYGPIFSLRVGSRRIVIVSSPSLVQECFSGKNDQVFANRPPFLNSKYVAYNNTTVGTAPYGPHWRNLRRIYTIEMLTSQRLSLFQPIRSDELRRMVAKLARGASAGGFAAVDLRKTVTTVVLNNVMRVIAGKRYYDEDGGRSKEEASSKFHAVIQDVMDKSGAGNLADYFPILTWIRSKYVKRMKELGFGMNEFMQGLVDEMRTKGERNDTMLGRLLALQEEEPHVYTDEIIKGLIQSVMVAATDTSIAAITWAMTNLLNHPRVLEKTRREIDDKAGQNRLLDESDLPDLPYLRNVMSETFRFHPPSPFLLPHYSSADCKVGGYDIPRGTILLVNTWAIHHDPSVWPDPESFRPERFDVVGEKEGDAYRLIPFGLGRRACPGATMGMRTVALTIGTLVQCFEWEKVGGGPVDLKEGTGPIMHKVEPLVAICRARALATRTMDEAY